MKRDRGRTEAGRPDTIHVDGRSIDSDAAHAMTTALRWSALSAVWDTLAVGRRVTLPDIEDVGAHLRDPRWDGWAARLAVKRLSDDPSTGGRRWRATVRVAMPGWTFISLYAVYVGLQDLPGEARSVRSATTADRRREAAALWAGGQRAGGLSTAQVAVRMFGKDPSENERRMVKRWLAPPTSAKKG